jgi:hypothetical protein
VKPGRGRIRSLTLPAVRLVDLQTLLLSNMGHDFLYKSDSGTVYTVYRIRYLNLFVVNANKDRLGFLRR